MQNDDTAFWFFVISISVIGLMAGIMILLKAY